jgi:hypothetical protein
MTFGTAENDNGAVILESSLAVAKQKQRLSLEKSP